MSGWSLAQLLAGLHDDIERRLSTARRHSAIPEPRAMRASMSGSNSYRRTFRCATAPKRPTSSTATACSAISWTLWYSTGRYSPFIFKYEEQIIIPAESVYAAFEAKQSINAAHIDYAQKKVASLRRLHRTSLPIPHAGGTYPPKPLAHILGGILTFDSEWNPPLGRSLTAAISAAPEDRLDLGCVAAHGIFTCDDARHHAVIAGGKPATAFVLELIARPQDGATVPMIDTRAYARWLEG